MAVPSGCTAPQKVRSVSEVWTHPNAPENTVRDQRAVRVQSENNGSKLLTVPKSGDQWCGSRTGTHSPGETEG